MKRAPHHQRTHVRQPSLTTWRRRARPPSWVWTWGGGHLRRPRLLEVGDGVVEVKAHQRRQTTSVGTTGTSASWTGWCRTFKNNYGHGPVQGQDGAAAAWREFRRRRPRSSCSGSAETHDQPALHHPLRAGPACTWTTKLTPGRVPEDDLGPARTAPRGPFQQVIKDGNTKLSDIQHVVLVGGSTRIAPPWWTLVKELLGRARRPNKGVKPGRRSSPWALLCRPACSRARSRMSLLAGT